MPLAAHPPEGCTDPAGPTSPLPARLQLIIWLDPDSSWHARAEWDPQQHCDFDSPLELARFVARLPLATATRRWGGLR